ncbi:large-conductance mechanosensitive channel protein MscL [Paenibacillus beijingensis]|uniref:Large-conductance mechanosensitive channel n=1 Tax=Paenibacillus beijingensis TaxID=1126833 RepID=A0A0D5NGE4_9BACL|nr:large-conductance mechanosensitive channel protein MscL [Paenibacillus beijingensis]AJY74464.1 mechanosensitive ion channel protein MscL [Paenibacillus beijingensis]
MKWIKEFKEFAMRGNVIDLAVGVIIGGAFGKITTSLVNDIIMPPIGLLLGGSNFKDLYLYLGWNNPYASLAEAKDNSAPIITYGQFISTVLDFIIVAFCIFLIVKGTNTLRRFRQDDQPASEKPKDKECPYCLSKVPVKATRCAFCTSHLEPEQKSGMMTDTDGTVKG